MTDCVICELNGRVGELPRRERAYLGEHWRVTHAWSALPGWLCVIARRHRTQLADLTPPEALELGLLLRAASLALRSAVGCAKTYVVLFAEKEGFAHIHFHVVPRAADLDPAHRGTGVFELLNRPESEWVPEDERDRLAALIGAKIEQGLGR